MPQARPKHSLLVLFLCLLLCNGTLYGQKSATGTLSMSSPEAEGVSSTMIDSFLNVVARSKHEFHSFMFLRHGKIVAQGWWNPYQSTFKHSLYSVSKSFTSTAIGFAVSEGKLTVYDKVVSFFPGSLPANMNPYLSGLTIKDLLTMSVGQEPDPTVKLALNSDDWVKDFLALPIVHQPGSKFLYNTMASFMLSAIIQKVTGEKVVDYLKPRLFGPLGIKGADWEVNNQGINTGGWGLRLKTEDMAKLGQLYLQNGVWNGKQLLPRAWIQEATTYKIDQAPGVSKNKRDSSDWMQGYCYQFWRCRNNAFRADGAFGQYIIVMPEQDAVIAITSETADMQGELNLVWKYLLPAMHPKKLQDNRAAQVKLQQHLAALNLPPLANKSSKTITTYSKTFAIDSNGLKINAITFDINNNVCRLTFKVDSANYNINFETGRWVPDETYMQGIGLLTKAKENFSLLLPYAVEGSFGWKDEQTLQLKLRYIESPHTETFTFHLDGEQLNAEVENSFDFGSKKLELQGEAISAEAVK